MKQETKTIIVLSGVVILFFLTSIMGFISTRKMSNTAAYHNAVQHRLEQTLINVDKSYSDSVTAIKYQEYNRVFK